MLLLVFAPSAFPHIIVRLSSMSPSNERFAALYLLSHGIIKAVLVYALLRGKLSAYPLAIGVFAGFGVYQMYRYSVAPSGWLIALTVLDVIVILLTWAEWRRVKSERAQPQ